LLREAFVLPALFFIIPIIDTTTVTVRRLLRGQSPLLAVKTTSLTILHILD
jgi:hypothetical protein